VQRLCHGHQIDARIIQAAALGRSDFVLHARVRLRIANLLRARVAGMHARKIPSQRDTGLTIAAARIPGRLVFWSQRRQRIEKRRRVQRARLTVVGGMRREMVLELCHVHELLNIGSKARARPDWLHRAQTSKQARPPI